MARLSLVVVLAALAAQVAGQEGSPSALPAVSAPSGMACGGCYVVADVAGIVFGGVATATQSNIVGVGSNGSVVTTSVVQHPGQVTFTDGAPVPGAATSFNPLSSVITVGGATLTSPTSYEVFTAFSVMSTVSGPNGCSVSSGSRSSLSTASTYPVPENADENFLLQVESSFIQAVGFPECSAGGGNVQSTVHSMITTTTQSVTTTGLIRPTPLPQSSPSTNTASATGTASTFNFPNITQASATPFPSVTITPAINDAPRPAVSWPLAGVLAAGAALARWL